MTDAFKQAIEKATALPPAARAQIAEELLLHIDKVGRLRTQLELAAHALDHDGGHELDMNDVIKRARAQYGRI